MSKSLFATPRALTSIPGQSQSYYPLRTVSRCTIAVTLSEKASIEQIEFDQSGIVIFPLNDRADFHYFASSFSILRALEAPIEDINYVIKR